MDINEQIAALGARLDNWFDEMSARMDAGDKPGQATEWLAGIQIPWRYDELKNRGFTILTALLNPVTVMSENERVAALLRGFEFAAKLEVTLYGQMMDTDAGNQVDDLMDEIVVTLAGIGSGRAALVPLLDHNNSGVSASAGRYLIDLIPDRVIPVLQGIEKSERGFQPGFEARMVLLTWECEHVGRFNALASRVTRNA